MSTFIAGIFSIIIVLFILAAIVACVVAPFAFLAWAWRQLATKKGGE